MSLHLSQEATHWCCKQAIMDDFIDAWSKCAYVEPKNLLLCVFWNIYLLPCDSKKSMRGFLKKNLKHALNDLFYGHDINGKGSSLKKYEHVRQL